MSRVAVDKKVLRWAVRRSGLELDDLERKFPRIRQWATGEILPTLRQLETLAKATFTPLGFFFLAEPPLQHQRGHVLAIIERGRLQVVVRAPDYVRVGRVPEQASDVLPLLLIELAVLEILLQVVGQDSQDVRDAVLKDLDKGVVGLTARNIFAYRT